jgi:hypothetical protein
MAKLSKKQLSDKLNDGATALRLTGERIGGKAGAQVANVIGAVFLGRWWTPCPDDCGCPDNVHA